MMLQTIRDYRAARETNVSNHCNKIKREHELRYLILDVFSEVDAEQVGDSLAGCELVKSHVMDPPLFKRTL